MSYLNLIKEYHDISIKLDEYKIKAQLLKGIAEEHLKEVDSKREERKIVERFSRVLQNIKKSSDKSTLTALKERKRSIEDKFNELDQNINVNRLRLKNSLQDDRSFNEDHEKILRQNDKDLSLLQFKYINNGNRLRIQLDPRKKRRVGKVTNRIIKNNDADDKVVQLFDAVDSVDNVNS